MTRIYKKKTEIDVSKTHEFFESRGKNVNLDHPITSILYQDKNPSLALERDNYEKKKAEPLLRLNIKDDLLDVGCGIGRWSYVASQVHSYHGVDFSQNLIDLAVTNINAPNVTYQRLAAEDINLNNIDSIEEFSRVIIAGLLIYLNDDAVIKSLNGINECCRNDALIYMREPIALEDRLTLKEYWSNELNSDYSAIYRTRAELENIFQISLYKSGFELIYEKPLYPSHLNNRVETQQYIFVFKRS